MAQGLLELYKDKFLVGEAFPPDVRCFPSCKELPGISDWDNVGEYIATVREVRINWQQKLTQLMLLMYLVKTLIFY